MKEWSREKLTLLIILTVVFVTGFGIMIWQGVSNNNVMSSMAPNSYHEVQSSYNADNGGYNNPDNQSNPRNNSNNGSNSDNSNDITSSSDHEEDTRIMVHVAGEVISPGVYQLSDDARVVNAVEAAGGATSLANLDSINLATSISDGQKIYIPSVIERINQINNNGNSNNDSIDTATNLAANSSGKININTASASRLQELSGIGPSKAESIIDYRESNGRFENVDELLHVSGIGERTLEKIRDDIIVR
ncbi:MAG: helix-hairpin-helix domain-containing protein [Halanaerobiales bacterium]